MVTYLPISSPFIRFAGRFVDDAFGVAAGWNFFIFEAMLVPFEIVACNVIIHFWSDIVPAGGIIAIVIFLYGYVNLCAGDNSVLTFSQASSTCLPSSGMEKPSSGPPWAKYSLSLALSFLPSSQC
jgi:hypothetical protein